MMRVLSRQAFLKDCAASDSPRIIVIANSHGVFAGIFISATYMDSELSVTVRTLMGSKTQRFQDGAISGNCYTFLKPSEGIKVAAPKLPLG